MGFVMDYLKHRKDMKEDGICAAVYYRRKFNKAQLELEVYKEVVASDIYDKVVKNLTNPLEIRSLKATVKRQSRLLKAIREERNDLLKQLEAKNNGKKKKI